MSTVRKLMIQSIALAIILSTPVGSAFAQAPAVKPGPLAKEGGTSGGGAPKPWPAFGRENIDAILKSTEVSRTLGFAFGIEQVSLDRIDTGRAFVYKVVANSRMPQKQPCVLEVGVFNSDISTTSQVRIVDVKVISGCEIEKRVAAPSALDKFPEYFRMFPKPIAFQSSYWTYLAILGDGTTAAERQAMREFMVGSQEAKYAEVFTRHAKRMAEYLITHYSASIDEFYVELADVMGLRAGPGLNMAVLHGLSIAPLFIYDEWKALNDAENAADDARHKPIIELH